MITDRERAAERGRLKARGIVHRLKIRAADEIDVEAIAAYHRLFVERGGLTGADGRLVSNGKRGTIRIGDAIHDERRERFIIAHELGHHVIHAPKNEVSICTEGDLLRYEAGTGEPEANFFASELLMPTTLFRPLCDVDAPSFEIVRALSDQFRTTLTAAAIQFVELCPEACALVWSEAGTIKWFVRSSEFRHWIVPRSRLGVGTLAHGVFAGGRERERREEVLLDAWVEDGVDADVVEHTIALFGNRAALTLLWLPT